MDKTIKKILEETGANNVKDIVFNEEKDKWIVTYKNDLSPDEYEYFSHVLDHLIFD
jgi:hypothetical protein